MAQRLAFEVKAAAGRDAPRIDARGHAVRDTAPSAAWRTRQLSIHTHYGYSAAWNSKFHTSDRARRLDIPALHFIQARRGSMTDGGISDKSKAAMRLMALARVELDAGRISSSARLLREAAEIAADLEESMPDTMPATGSRQTDPA